MTPSTVRPQPLPPGLFTLADHERHAQTVLAPELWSYFHGAAADEITARANVSDWQRLGLCPRVLRQLTVPDTSAQLLGRTVPAPLLAAPLALQGLLHPDGELATALASSALGAGLVLSTQSNVPMERVAEVHLGGTQQGPLWFQLYCLGNRDWQLETAQRAANAGFEALVVTVDAPVQGVRDRERRSGFALPPNLPLPNAPRTLSGRAAGLNELLRHTACWDDIHWLIQHAPLPVLLKGITHPLDADLACQAGAAGIVVSNHGGRVLDTLPSTAVLLPAVVSAVAQRCDVLVDGGIRRGTDVLKALALGASAVLIGRPVAYGLANAGASGVAHVLRLLMDELTAAMLLCGITKLQDIGPDVLHRHPSII
ncbi:MAG TPA: alpha-hydroxy acid oxidase [Macromonas sp.]|nr:alpha-hydroxy acid oxidase [Macromonas sp.]